MTTIASWLGYPEDLPDPTLPTSRQADVTQTLADLASVTSAIRTAQTDSMALQVGDLKVDYARHLALLRAEGSRLVALLAVQANLPIVYDQFTGKLHKDPEQFRERYLDPYRQLPSETFSRQAYETLKGLNGSGGYSVESYS